MRSIAIWGSIGALCATIAGHASAQGIPHYELTLDDSYILGVRANVDQEEIETARWATTHASNKQVREFAQSLLRGHSNAQNAAQLLAYQLKVELKIPGDTDQAIHDRNVAVQASLRGLKGTKFDRAFLVAIRDEHTSEIEKVNSWYASIAASDSVKAYLHDIMPTLVKHQQTAEKLLNGSPKAVAVR
jgi:putative membrane protein